MTDETNFTCSKCSAACRKSGSTNCWSTDAENKPPKPGNCPTRHHEDVIKESFDLYRGDEEDARMANVAAKVEVSTLDGTSATASTESECYLAAAIPGPSGADQPEKIYRSAADGLGASPSAMHVKTASTATATASGTITGSSGGITGGSVINHNTGGSLPFSLYQPCLGLNYDMCIQGIFPSRN